MFFLHVCVEARCVVVERCGSVAAHDFAPATCRLRRFDARDFAGRCAAGRRVAFLGDSLGEQVWKCSHLVFDRGSN